MFEIILRFISGAVDKIVIFIPFDDFFREFYPGFPVTEHLLLIHQKILTKLIQQKLFFTFN